VINGFLLTAKRLFRLRIECPTIDPPNISNNVNFWITYMQVTFRNNYTIGFTKVYVFAR